jgi:hypothetical protein
MNVVTNQTSDDHPPYQKRGFEVGFTALSTTPRENSVGSIAPSKAPSPFRAFCTLSLIGEYTEPTKALVMYENADCVDLTFRKHIRRQVIDEFCSDYASDNLNMLVKSNWLRSLY